MPIATISKRIYSFLLFLFIFFPISADQIQEIYRIRIQNELGGNIWVSKDEGKSWEIIGHVLYPASEINPQGFTASKWGKISTVVASAVNSIHIKTAHDRRLDKGMIFTLKPKDEIKKKVLVSKQTESIIFTDIAAGTKIFGGDCPPLVGSPVEYKRGSHWSFLDEHFQPQTGDEIQIRALIPKPYPAAIIFENYFQGRIRMVYADQTEKIIGKVLKPVQGVGRFIGTEYASPGRIRANHTGVIDISTAPKGELGGFQIIPANHGNSKEMQKSKLKPQWMVIESSEDLSQNTGEGVSPLFSDYLIPNNMPLDETDQKHWKEQLAQRCLVKIRYLGKKDWDMMPAFSYSLDRKLPPEADEALKNIAEIKIELPQY